MNSNAVLADAAATAPAVKEPETLGSFLLFVLKLVVAVILFRTLLFTPFTIPSESMLPRLQNGDYLVSAKWPYGYSRWSLPLGADLFEGRVFAGLPERGDVIVFKHPVDHVDYVKRAIGLPGDMVEMRKGQLILNGTPVPKQRIADFVIAVSPNTDCHARATPIQTADGPACRYTRFRETLPGGKSYEVLDFGQWMADDVAPFMVPEGKVFAMGDNRDNSLDSRFPAAAGGGVGLIDTDLLVGRASMILWSTDGSAEWLLPWTWFTAARWDRIGEVL